MLEAFLHFLDRKRGGVAVVTVAALLASCYFAARLEILDSPERWMPSTTLAAWDVFAEHFDAGDTVGIGLNFKRPITEDDLPRLRALREQLRAIQGIQQVYDCSLVAEEIERVPLLELIDPANAKRFELYSGVLWDTPAAGETTRTLMTVGELIFYPGEDKKDPATLNTRRRHVAAEVARIVAAEKESGRWTHVDFHVASGIMMMGELEKRTRQVAWTFLPISLAVGLASFLWCFRSWRAVLVAVGGSAAAMLLVLGWLGAGGGTLGVVTMAAPTLIAIIGTAATVHFASHARPMDASAGASVHDRRFDDAHRRDLVKWVAVPCFGSAVTTGVGFLMLGFNELGPVRDLGQQVFAGAILAFFGVFVLSQWTPIRATAVRPWLSAARLSAFGRAVTARPGAVVAGSAVVFALLIFVAWPRPKDRALGVYVDADPFSFFSNDQPIKIALNHFSARKFAVFQLDVIMVPRAQGRPPAGLEPPDKQYLENLEAADKFSRAVMAREDLGVIRVLSTISFDRRYVEILRQVYEGMTGAAPTGTANGAGPGQASGGEPAEGRLTTLAGLSPKATAATMLASTFRAWKVDKKNEGALRFTFVAHDSASGFGPLVDYVRSQLPSDRFDCHLAGSVQGNVDLTGGLTRSMVDALGAALAVMLVVCSVLFRSLKLALIALVPSVLPILTVFALMGVTKMPLSSGSAMVSTIALGIALTDTIHFLTRYRERTRVSGHAPREAVLETIVISGRPIILTSLVHTAGFLIFLTTDFLPLFHFGFLSSVAMLAAMVSTLVVLPCLLLVLDRPRGVVATA
ncbi:MAG: MMPL family transporter [Planctomycetia bacterium]|nr:MMPL family transporter [Planctomycetia bacterium]